MGFALKQRGIKVSARREVAEQNRVRLSYERRLALNLRNLFARIGRNAQNEYEQTGNVRISLSFDGELRDILTQHYRAVIDEFALRVLRKVGRKGDSQFETLVQQFIARRGGNRITQISTTTKVEIRKVIYQGREGGLGPGPIGRSIYDHMTGAFSRGRSTTIARTETHNAASYATHEQHKGLGIEFRKQWVSTNDDRTRSEHGAANGQVVGMDEPFTIGGAKMEYPGDPKGGAKNVINCRCVVMYLEPEDEVVDDTPVIAQEQPQERQTDFTPPPVASIMFKQASDARKAVTDRLAANGLDARHPQSNRFRGRDATMWGKTGDLPDDVMVALEPCLEDCDRLATLFNVPALRGIKNISGRRANADMGDGVMGIHPDQMGKRIRGGRLTATGQRTNDWVPDHDNWETNKNGRDWTVSAHVDTGFEKFRSTVYHEFGHHVHQMYGVSVQTWNDNIGRGRYRWKPPVEVKISRTRGRKAPSVYGDTNYREWFAENFAAYFTGNRHLCDPKFVKIIKELIRDAYK